MSDTKIEWATRGRISSHGYVLVYVGEKHHLADVNGEAYEHRIVAEKVIGRSLGPGETVHHLDGIKSNNAPENIVVCPTIRHHRANHRKRHDKSLRMPGEPNPVIACACGCGGMFTKYDSSGRPRGYITGHNSIPKERPLCSCGCGGTLKYGARYYLFGHGTKKARNHPISCACGCGSEFQLYDAHGRERRFVSGHNQRGANGQF